MKGWFQGHILCPSSSWRRKTKPINLLFICGREKSSNYDWASFFAKEERERERQSECVRLWQCVQETECVRLWQCAQETECVRLWQCDSVCKREHLPRESERERKKTFYVCASVQMFKMKFIVFLRVVLGFALKKGSVANPINALLL